jgi:hypothetical protein
MGLWNAGPWLRFLVVPGSLSDMKRLACLAALTIFLALPAFADERGLEVEAFMAEYLRLWNAHDARAITDHVYRFDRPNPMGDLAGLEAEFARLKAQGYDHSTKTSIEACLIGQDRALAEFRFSRLKADGAPLPPKDRATLYFLRRFPDGWRITQMVGFDARAKITCSSVAG